MTYRLLVTLKSGGVARTVSFDEQTQSVAWLGMGADVGPESSVARLELVGGGARLVASGGYRVVRPDCDGALEVPSDEDLVVDVEGARGEGRTQLHLRPVRAGVRRFRKLGIDGGSRLVIGRSPACDLVYDMRFVSARHAELSHAEGRLTVTDLGSANGTVVNGRKLVPHQPHWLSPGDVIEILDLTVAIGSGFVCVNEPQGLSLRAARGTALLTHAEVRERMPDVEATDEDLEVFYPAPRLSKSVHPLKMSVDDPPAKKPQEDQPVIMQIGPSFLMGLSSVFMVASSVSRIAEGAGALSVAPSIAMAVAMVGGSVVWPVVARAYGRRRDAREETRRERLYVSYLDGIENRLSAEASAQAQILAENRRPVGELMERALSRSPLLMSHTSVHEDFLDLRVGTGDADLAADIAWPQHHFSLADDRMLDAVDDLSRRPPRLHDVPLAFNPTTNDVVGILGERALVWEFLRGLLVQVCALYSYQDVKVVMLSDESELPEWEFLTHLGHLHDASGRHRHAVLSPSGMIEEDLLLSREIEARSQVRSEVLGDFGTYYLIVCASSRLAKRSEAARRLLRMRDNRGFSLIYLGEGLSDLPRECGYIVDLNPGSSTNLGISLDVTTHGRERVPRGARMFERADVQGTLRQFDPDIMVSRERAHAFALGLAQVTLDVPEQRGAIPETVGFLELFEVGNVAHLNIGQRWARHDASQTLQTPIGVGAEGEPAVLDLHENIHGPHGLIAGTTGSGKSELIITYILSLCVNYAPDEVAFVLIDYKGGGLAGAFENDRHHLPHLAGTITNLDGGAIQRSLVSIRSELKRRQDLFRQARDATGEATIDIYKYLSFYRQGVLSEPLPHLFIVADEFAELKAQEPEFMDELISAARIGRSLGVHLILATQKPTGVVNDQIWSNARFKISLKVSDAADSREMIRRDDAAEITRPGRYYLLVGYNESFSAGQSAYAGGTYAPADVFEPRRDNAVELLDAEGATVARLRPAPARGAGGDSELVAVLSQIEETAALSGRSAQRLWLDPLPARISLDSLARRYGAQRGDGLVCRAGEVDDPENQRQYPLELDIAEAGNVMLYGSQSSGVDGLLQAMLVSLAGSHGPDALWVYGIDYGSGLLMSLLGLPHVGGVVTSGDTERLGNLFRMLEQELDARRSLLASHGGSVEAYNAGARRPLARIVVAIDNLALLQERGEAVEDVLVRLTRDAPRYGIHFLVTAATASVPRMRLRANFGVDVPTMLNDPADYVMIFGSVRDAVPPQRERRGLVRQGKRLLEFQGLSVADRDGEEGAVIARVANEAREATSACARPIPVLPAYVCADDMGPQADARQVPIGFSKQGIEPVWHSLARTPYMLVLGDDGEALGMYLRGLRDVCARSRADWCFVDAQGLLGDAAGARVLHDADDVAAFVGALYEGSEAPSVVVFTSIVQTMDGLPAGAAQHLQDYITQERGAGRTALVAATEMWRARSLYQDWYKVVTSAGCGVWAGGGFSDQTLFRFSRSLPEYRAAPARSDGFYVVRGSVRAVRLLEATDEPRDMVDEERGMAP